MLHYASVIKYAERGDYGAHDGIFQAQGHDRINVLGRRMSEILNDTTTPDELRWLNYNQALQEYLRLRMLGSRPITMKMRTLPQPPPAPPMPFTLTPEETWGYFEDHSGKMAG